MKRLSVFTALLLTAFAVEANAYTEDNVTTLETPAPQMEPRSELRRHALSTELLGRGGLYSFNYDYMILDNLAIGAGVSTYSISSGTSSAKATIIPAYANYYVNDGNHRFFGSAGANIIHASGKIDDSAQVSGSGLAGVLGGGYEYRNDSGFLFRAAPYVFVGKASGVWLGFSFGYTI